MNTTGARRLRQRLKAVDHHLDARKQPGDNPGTNAAGGARCAATDDVLGQNDRYVESMTPISAYLYCKSSGVLYPRDTLHIGAYEIPWELS